MCCVNFTISLNFLFGSELLKNIEIYTYSCDSFLLCTTSEYVPSVDSFRSEVEASGCACAIGEGVLLIWVLYPENNVVWKAMMEC